MKTAFAKIQEFSTYTKGWDFGEGDSFSSRTIMRAFILNRCLLAFRTSETDAFPGSDGKIVVTAYADSWCWEFTVQENGTIGYIVEEDDNIVEEHEGLLFKEALLIIKTRPIERRNPIWSQYESLTKRNMTKEKKDSEVKPLNQLVMNLAFPVFPLSTQNVLRTPPIGSAHTSRSTMLVPQEFQLSFGNLTPKFSPKAIK